MGSNVEKKEEKVSADIERKIQWLDDCINNSKKRISELENGFPNEKTDFYIKQEKALLEEFEVRKFNLQNEFEEFAFLDEDSNTINRRK